MVRPCFSQGSEQKKEPIEECSEARAGQGGVAHD
jgi:hypothetical protein